MKRKSGVLASIHCYHHGPWGESLGYTPIRWNSDVTGMTFVSICEFQHCPMYTF